MVSPLDLATAVPWLLHSAHRPRPGTQLAANGLLGALEPKTYTSAAVPSNCA